MPETALRTEADDEPTRDQPAGMRTTTQRPAVDAEMLLSVLSDEYCQDILKEIADEALPARELATRLEISRATVYRRLDSLADAGLVETTMSYHPDGHHRKQYRVTLEAVRLSFEGGDIAVDDCQRERDCHGGPAEMTFPE